MGKLIEMLLAERPFNMISTGEKTVEVRLFDEKRREVKVGDEIKFICREDVSRFIITKVTFLRRFETFEQLYSSEIGRDAGMKKMNAIEAAEGLKELMDNHGLTQEEVAIRIGKSRPYVTNTLRLLQLPAEVADMVRNGDLSPGHARALISIDDKDYLITLAKQACDNKLTVREIENRVRLYFTRKAIPGGPRKEREVVSVELKEMVNDMKRIFATKVKLLGNDKKGRIIIDYFSEDDIDRIHALVQVLKLNEKL